MSLDETEDFLYGYQEEDKNIEELATEWITNNRSQIDTWLQK
jgi:ABC-type proline/glycine betaine transport system substrate-binding protein